MPFVPSEFEFTPNSVQFRCPHCGQSYYGTGPRGHLEPEAFDCVSCGRHIHMDDMIIFPTDGVHEEQTRVAHVPWLERRERGFWRGWFSTIGMALTSPIKLMRDLPRETSSGQALWFTLITFFFISTASMLPFVVLMVILSAFAGAGAMEVGFFVIGGIISFAILLVGMFIWLLATHGLLLITGRKAGGLELTFQAMGYSSGANVFSAVPFLGWYFGWIWWLISAVLMVKERQKIGGGRAAFAVLTPPLTILGGLIGLYIYFIVSIVSTGFGTVQYRVANDATTQTVTNGIITHARQQNGFGPDHAAQLIESGQVLVSNLIIADSDTSMKDVPVADTTLDRYGRLTDEERRAATRAAVDALPPDTVAHRLGDFVFTYHGIDFNNLKGRQPPEPELWIVVLWPDPDVNQPPSSTAQVIVGRADGATTMLPVNSFDIFLQLQNDERAKLGLPPLPHPSKVTHTQPALAGGTKGD